MASNVYECFLILDSNRYARDPGGISGQIPQMVEKCGGEVLASRLWNEQKLAYPIQGHRKGTYWLTYFRVDAAKIAEFRRACQLNDNVLRSLTLKVEPRLVDTLVALARGELKEQPAGEPPAAATTGEAKPQRAPQTVPASTGDAGTPQPAKEAESQG